MLNSTFEEIINCQYIKTAELCGLEPANIMRCIAVDVMTGSLPVIYDVDDRLCS